MDTLDDILKPGGWKPIGSFYVPIDRDDNKNWLREFISGEGSDEQKLQALKTHKMLRKGQIVRTELDNLGLPVVMYRDDQGKFLEEFYEFIFLYSLGPHRIDRVSIDELEPYRIRELKTYFTYNNFEPGFGWEKMKKKITEIDGFKIDRQDEKWFGASKKFEKNESAVELEYSLKMDKTRKVESFSISINVDYNNKPIAHSEIKVDAKSGIYTPSGEIWIPSTRFKQDECGNKWVRYYFGADGSFESVGAFGMTFNRQQCESDITKYEEMKVLDLAEDDIPSGIKKDVMLLRFYRILCTELFENPIFKITPDQVQINYVDAIKTMAGMKEYNPDKPESLGRGGGGQLSSGSLWQLPIALLPALGSLFGGVTYHSSIQGPNGVRAHNNTQYTARAHRQ